MKISVKKLRRQNIQRLLIESVDLSLYIAHAEIDEQRYIIAGEDGKPLKTRNLLEMKQALASLKSEERVMIQRSAYDEMVGQPFPRADNCMELPLAPGFESLPTWEH
ncbi:MAG: hypothetical protein Cons2KO_12400 [Congregibacter sp.]